MPVPLHVYIYAPTPPTAFAVSVDVPPRQIVPLLVGAAVGTAFTLNVEVTPLTGVLQLVETYDMKLIDIVVDPGLVSPPTTKLAAPVPPLVVIVPTPPGLLAPLHVKLMK